MGEGGVKCADPLDPGNTSDELEVIGEPKLKATEAVSDDIEAPELETGDDDVGV